FFHEDITKQMTPPHYERSSSSRQKRLPLSFGSHIKKTHSHTHRYSREVGKKARMYKENSPSIFVFHFLRFLDIV
ncbi:hypothetical protein A4A49_55995, partial [Nicotiana attenuata]